MDDGHQYWLDGRRRSFVCPLSLLCVPLPPQQEPVMVQEVGPIFNHRTKGSEGTKLLTSTPEILVQIHGCHVYPGHWFPLYCFRPIFNALTYTYISSHFNHIVLFIPQSSPVQCNLIDPFRGRQKLIVVSVWNGFGGKKLSSASTLPYHVH